MHKPGITIFLYIFIIVVTSWLVVSRLTPYGSATMPDSLAYLDIANNIKNGEGFLTSDFSLDNAGTHSFTENRSWPPLYPCLLSIFINNASDISSVSLVSKFLLGVCIVFVFLIIYPVNGSAAFISSLLLCFTVPVITVYTYAWSETLFLPIFIVLVWASIEYLDIHRRSLIYRITISSILLTMMILLVYTRYIGLFFVVLFPVVYFFSNKDTFDRLFFAAGSFVYTAAVCYLLYGNYIISGSISGMVRQPSDKTIIENLVDVYHAVITIFPTSTLSLILALIAAVSVVFIIKKSGIYKISPINKKLRRRVYILIAVIAVYLLSIISLRSYSRFDILDVRLLAPAFVAIYMLMTILPLFFDINNGTRITFSIVIFAFITSVSINGYTQWTTTANNWKEAETPKLRLNDKLIYNNFTRSPETRSRNIKMFSGLVKDGGFIVVNAPLVCKFITGVKCVRKPDNITPEIITKINSLPGGSLLFLDKNELNEFNNRYAGMAVDYKYTDLGNIMAIKLPIHISTQ